MEKEVTIAENTPAAGTSCLSSNATLFWRVFVPVFGTVFWTGILLGTWLTDGEDLYMPFVPMLTMRVVFLLLWAGWLYYVYRALWPLKRIDADTTPPLQTVPKHRRPHPLVRVPTGAAQR